MAQTDSGIIRTFKKRHNFVIIDKTALEDARLSYKARGILGFLLCKPDGWITNTQNLVNNSDKDGKESVASGLKELEVCGYLRRKRVRDSKGCFRWEINVFETPEDRSRWEREAFASIDGFPGDGKPGDGKTGDGKPGYILNKEVVTTKEIINDPIINHTQEAEKENCVCEPIDVASSLKEPDWEKIGNETESDQALDLATSVEDKKKNPHVANQSSRPDQHSAAARSSEKANNGSCWQCPQPELRIEFLKWRSQGMGKGATITKASNWCNKYPESANDSFAEFLESRRPPEPQQAPATPLEAFLTGCGAKLRGIVLSSNFTPEETNYIARLWEAGGKDEDLTIMLLEQEGMIK